MAPLQFWKPGTAGPGKRSTLPPQRVANTLLRSQAVASTENPKPREVYYYQYPRRRTNSNPVTPLLHR